MQALQSLGVARGSLVETLQNLRGLFRQERRPSMLDLSGERGNEPLVSSADSFSYTSPPIDSPQLGAIVRGRPATYASFDTRPCELPPDWKRTGYAGPWKLQENEEKTRATRG